MKATLPLIALALLSFASCDITTNSSKTTPSESTIDSTGNGLKVTRKADGTLVSKVPYVDSLRHGTGLSYYPSGKVQLEIEYKKGSKNGIEKYFYENGRVYRVTKYNDNVKDSIQVFYHENGKLMAEVPYSNGILCSGTKEFNDQGKALSTPEVIIKEVDETAMTGRYHLEFSLSRRMRKVEFFEISDKENIPCPQYKLEVPNVKGKIRFSIPVPRGSFFMVEETFGAECMSYQRIPHLIFKRFALSVSNR